MFAVGKKIGTGIEQIIYEHFLYVVRTETPVKVLERFRSLFIEGVHYSDNRIWTTIETLAFEKTAEQNFPLIVNRCCYILVNHWQMQPSGQIPVASLVAMLANLCDVRMTYSRVVRRLRQLLQLYLQSDDYPKLKRLNAVLNGNTSGKDTIGEQQLGTLINRYPYLYEHSLVTEERTFENVETIKRVQRGLRQQQETNLSHYLTYQVRRSRIKAQLGRDAANNLPSITNPTLLSTKELGMAFGQFAGKAEGDATYQDLSRGFVSHLQMQPIIKIFKGDLYDYIVSGVDSSYGKRSFNDRLYKTIDAILPDRDNQQLDEISLLRTCTHVLNHLVVESPRNPQHFIFMDMISNLGAVFTTGLLLKIVLICQKVKPLLESRLSILFNHYESSQCKGVPWLVRSLENWNVAGAIHFGKIDASALSFLQSIGE
ncbi:MAG: hypothetical protein LH613_01640 [Chamaesiphon sp.]|nr:hypothetical protein [Chamaesiphon sp.]